MPVTIEEEIVLLYALHMCGGRPSKSRATEYILRHEYLKEREGDEDAVSTGESRIENRIAWTRQNLKQKGQLSMPEHGTWAITDVGRQRLRRAALKSLTWDDDSVFGDLGILWDRFSPQFLEDLKALGAKFTEQEENANRVPATGSK